MELRLQFFGGGGAGAGLDKKNDLVVKKAKVFKKLFHGSSAVDITEFDISKSGQNTGTNEGAIFFTDDYNVADEFSYQRIDSGSLINDIKGTKGKVYEVELVMKNPLDFRKLSDRDKEAIITVAKHNGVDYLTKEMVEQRSKMNHQLLKTEIGNLSELKKYGYDGIIAKMYRDRPALEYGVFDKRKIKMKTRAK